ncbi:MAG: hypothetical protein R2712_19450 [Vicinamibacterales bacterium]
MPNDVQTSPPRSRWSRLRRRLAIAGLVVFLLVAIAVVAVQSPAGRRFVKGQVTRLLAERHIAFSADELDYNLFDLSVALDNLRVAPTDRPDLPPLLTAERVSLDLERDRTHRRRACVLERHGHRRCRPLRRACAGGGQPAAPA